MSILNITYPVTGLADATPQLLYISTNDLLATVLVAGYLNQAIPVYGKIFSNQQMAIVYTTDSLSVLLQVSVNAQTGVVTLQSASTAGEVTLPTIANHIATYTNTTGGLSEDPATAISAGSIQAGLTTGTTGALYSCPGTTTTGRLGLKAVASAGAYDVLISNVSFGQASTMSFADPGSAAGRFLVANTATPFTSGNIPKASGTGGLMVDSAIAATNLMVLNAVNTMAAASQIILDKGTGTEAANAVTINKQSGVITTTSLTTAGGATETITLTNSEVAANSVVLASIGNGGVGGNTATNAYTVTTTVTLHTVVFVITNLTAATALNGTLVINFAVF